MVNDIKKYLLKLRKKFFSWLKANRKKLIIAGIVLAVIWGGLKLFGPKAANPETYRVKPETLTLEFAAKGSVKSYSDTGVKFNLPGKLSWIGVKKGDHVYKWQALASLDRRVLTKDLETALSQYMTTRWDFETTQHDTYKDKLITDVIKRDLEKSQFSLDRSVLAVEIADIAKKEAVITSPVEGTVVSTGDLVAGTNLSAADIGTKFIRVADMTDLYFAADVDETDYAKMKNGQDAVITVDAYPGEDCKGKVAFVGQLGEETSGGVITVPAEISLKDCKLNLALNLNGEARFITGTVKNALAIPKKYLINENGRYSVWKQTGSSPDKREKVSVKPGRSTASEVEINGGLKQGDTVIYVP